MRKIVGVLVGCLVLSGCAGAAKWEQDVRFKIVKVYEVGAEHDRKYDTLRLELVGDVPEDVLEPDTVTRRPASGGRSPARCARVTRSCATRRRRPTATRRPL
jgi:hypothetical protein